MAITAKQKVYGCVLGAGVAAFAADKLFLAPNEAAAQSLPVAEYAITSLTSELDAARSDLAAMALVPTEGNDLAGSLEAFAQTRSLDLTNMRDAFKPAVERPSVGNSQTGFYEVDRVAGLKDLDDVVSEVVAE